MSYSLKFEHPQFPEGKEFAINFLGMVKNGETLEIDEENERTFVANYGKSVEDAFSSNPLVTLTGSSTLGADEMKQLLPAPTESNSNSNNNADENDPNALIKSGGEGVNENA